MPGVVCHAWLNSLLSFDTPASAALNKFDVQLLLVVEARFVLGSVLWLLLRLRRLMNWNPGSGFLLGPEQVWSGPNLCFRQWSLVQSLHLIVLENVRASLQPLTGHFGFLVTFS